MSLQRYSVPHLVGLLLLVLLGSTSASSLEALDEQQSRQLLLRPRLREGRRFHTSRDATSNATSSRQQSSDMSDQNEQQQQHESERPVDESRAEEIATQTSQISEADSSSAHQSSEAEPYQQHLTISDQSQDSGTTSNQQSTADTSTHQSATGNEGSGTKQQHNSTSESSQKPEEAPMQQKGGRLHGSKRHAAQRGMAKPDRGASWQQAQQSANDSAVLQQSGSSQAHNTSQQKSYDVTKIRTYTDWDGQPSWEWDNPRTLYFEPVAGLGNRLRALASAVVIAREAGVGLKVIWREEVDCGPECGNMPPFNSTWQDLFSYPKLRLASNFPGSNYSVHHENVWLRPNMSLENPIMPPVVRGFNCSVHHAQNYSHFKELLAQQWTEVHGEQVLCVKSDLWLTRNGEVEGKFFFRLLQPSPIVKQMVDEYKLSVAWDDHHFVGVHIRRTDLHLAVPDGTKLRVDSLVSLSKYVDALRKLMGLAPSIGGKTIFLATDDEEAEKIVRSSFEDGIVHTFPKTAWSRSTVEGIQQALVDVLLLAECPVLIGTYYSSYSETAKLIGWPYYIQIGHELADLSLMSKFDGPESQ